MTPRPLPAHEKGTNGEHCPKKKNPLPVALGNTLKLILLLDGVRVRAALGGVDQLFSQALGNALDVAEGGLTGANGQEGNGLVDTAERGDIDGLTTDGTGGTDTGAVFTRTAVDDSVDGDLDGVLVGHDVDLGDNLLEGTAHIAQLLKTEVQWVTYDLEGVGDNADGHSLLTVVAAVHHERVGQTLNDGALRLAETLDGVPASGVREVDGSADLDVVAACEFSSQHI